MDTDLIAVERKLDRVKRLLDAEVMIDVLSGLLVSKGIITEDELAGETARVKSTEKYDFDIHEAEEDIKVFRVMRNTEAEEIARMHDLLKEDGTLKTLDELLAEERSMHDEAE